MADILIREFEMPETCGQCPIFNFDYNICNILSTHHHEYETSRIDGCPLHELPEHGDLIDISNAENALFVAGNYHINDYKKGWNDGIKAVIENAPVVIPSNKEDTE